MRAATIQIGSSRYTLDELHFAFDVRFEANVRLCTAEAQVYNLSATTRNAIEKGQPLIINAGYRDDIGVIFNGEINSAVHEKQNVDWVTKIGATAVLAQWLTAEINKTYAVGSTAESIVSDLLNIFSVEIGMCELAENVSYPRGKVCRGKVEEILQQIVVSDCKSRLLIKNGQVIISDPNKGVSSGYLLSPTTGLLRCMAEKDEKQTETALDTKKTREQKDAEAPKKSVECLLNYHLGVADAIQVQSSRLNGNYLIVKGSHKGDRSGDWKTTVELQAV